MLEGIRRFASARFGSKAAAPGAKPVMRYLRPDSSGILHGWNPALRSKAEDVSRAWVKASAMTIDAIQNGGLLSGIVDQVSADMVGGAGLTLNAVPDVDELRWSDDYRDFWTRKVEGRWRRYSCNPVECDARGRMTIAAMTDHIARSFLAYGEGCARIVVRPRSISRSATRVQLISPHRISQDTNELAGLHQGVFLDADGMAVGYRLKTRVSGFDRDIDVRARDADGRPLFVHVFDGDADQTRGITPFAPVLKVVRQADQLADATLTAALLQTIFAATLKSQGLSAEAFEGLLEQGEGELDEAGSIGRLLGAQQDFYEGAGLDLGRHGRINKLFPGDELTLHASNHPGGNYLPFNRNLWREVAACAGVTAEAATGDYDGATYSSIRMGIASKWPINLRRRARIAVPFVQAVYEAWLEEEVATGAIQFPGGYSAFLRNRAAASQAQWRGPAKPTADDLKTAKALDAHKTMGSMSLATICAEVGTDWQEEMDQRAQESAYARKRGLPDPHAPKGAVLPWPKEEEEDEDGQPA